MRILSRLSLVILTALFFILASGCSKGSFREEIDLTGTWSFTADSTATGDSEGWGENGLPAALVRQVSVPHTWNTEPALAKYTGKGWYQRTFSIGPGLLSGMVRLQFDGVYHDAFIWINGQKAGEHRGSGYNRFFVNITPFIHEGENTLTVCADNSFARDNIPFMRSYDWACDGGIYRGVKIIATDRIAVRNILVTATPVNNSGRVSLKISFVDPAVIDTSHLSMNATITEENQATAKTVFEGKLQGRFVDGCFISTLGLDDIKLWHFDSPDLYRLKITLSDKNSEKDEYSTVFGFRTIKTDQSRYILNGEPVRLMGVEWMPGSTFEKGMAEDTSDFAGNLRLMKEANAVFTRFHWQQDEYIFDWCDRHGIMVQEEIPYWGIWTLLNDTLLPRGFQHLDEMIDNHYNHPSIVSWGIGNELLAHEPFIKSGLKKLGQHVRSMDTTRLVTYVSNSLFFEMPSENRERYDATADYDMMMFNEYYSTWYNKTIDIIPSELDRIIGEYPGKSMTISEWGLCDPPQPGGDERRAREMARQMEIYGSKPYISGAIYFCLNDYRSQRGSDYSKGYPVRDHGVTDGYLHKKKSYETLKAVSSPIEIAGVVKENGKLNITLRGKTGIPSYTVRNYRIISGDTTLLINELKPGQEKTFTIPGNPGELQIYRPTGFEVLNLTL